MIIHGFTCDFAMKGGARAVVLAYAKGNVERVSVCIVALLGGAAMGIGIGLLVGYALGRLHRGEGRPGAPRSIQAARPAGAGLSAACYDESPHQKVETTQGSYRRHWTVTTKGRLKPPRIMSDWSDEQTDDPLYADLRNFYKVEAWSRDGMRIDALLYAGNSLDKAREILSRPSSIGRALG